MTSGSGTLDVLSRVVAAPGRELVLVTGVLAAAASATSSVFMATGSRKLLNRANVLGTLVHEGGHALVSVVTGGRVYRVAIESPESGFTEHTRTPRFSLALTAAAGYAMPPLSGLGAAALLHRGLAPAVLALTIVIMALLLLVTRDLLTLLVVLLIGGIVFVALRWGADALLNGVAYTEAWLLLTSEIGGLAAIISNRMRFHEQTDDAAALAKLTFIPSAVWILGWAALITWSVTTAAPLLWP